MPVGIPNFAENVCMSIAIRLHAAMADCGHFPLFSTIRFRDNIWHMFKQEIDAGNRLFRRTIVTKIVVLLCCLSSIELVDAWMDKAELEEKTATVVPDELHHNILGLRPQLRSEGLPKERSVRQIGRRPVIIFFMSLRPTGLRYD